MVTAPGQSPGMVVALPCIAQFVIVLDVTIVAIALPALQVDFGLSTAALGWLIGAASLACGLAPGPGALFVARAVQGLGAALVSPAALALVTAARPEGR